MAIYTTLQAKSLRQLATYETILDKYGLKMTSESYATESAHIEFLLADLASDEAVAAIGKLPGISECISKLTASQEAFVADFVAYEVSKSKDAAYNNATAIKKDLLQIINGGAFRNH